MSNILNSIIATIGNTGRMFQDALDRIFPPDKRAEVLANLRTFAVNNPKLAAFLTTQIALTGMPLLLFLTFSLTVFLFSLIATLLVSLVAALLFTVFMVGVALVVTLPIVFLTTFAASFIFLWGLGGYYILKWFNESEAPAPEGKAIGDKLNSLTGGRLGWLTDGARKKQEDTRTGVDWTPKVNGSDTNGTNGQAGGGATDVTKHAEKAKDNATGQVNGIQKRASKSGGAVTSTAGTADGAVDGATRT